ncbi:MAG: hypothetical protein ACRDK0_08630 [Solirubrobacteraceae bacterium]
MLARRLLILLAVLMGLTALAAGVAPRQPLRTDTPPPAATPRSGRPPEPIEHTLSTRTGREEERVEAELGQVVRLTIEGDELDSVAVGELGIEPVSADSPALFELLLDVPGSYPITLLESGRRIGVLVVEG